MMNMRRSEKVREPWIGEGPATLGFVCVQPASENGIDFDVFGKISLDRRTILGRGDGGDHVLQMDAFVFCEDHPNLLVFPCGLVDHGYLTGVDLSPSGCARTVFGSYLFENFDHHRGVVLGCAVVYHCLWLKGRIQEATGAVFSHGSHLVIQP
jgi:hypothetical protein